MKSEKLKQIETFLENHRGNEECCRMCPRDCKVDRHQKVGECREPYLPRIASANVHKGEEPPISGERGSGTIFFAGCSLHCVFCQNFPISQLHQANRQLTIAELADTMITLQKRGVHNINLVTPTHYILQIVSALKIAYENGLEIPIVYNTSGYDRVEIVRDLEGIVDVYLPDIKYADDHLSMFYSSVPDYVEVNRACLSEMYRQKGVELDLDESGIIRSGMIVRHLALPTHPENSTQALKWLSENLSPKISLSLMSQYFPAYRVNELAEYEHLRGKLSNEEYDMILECADALGFENGWFQPVSDTDAELQ